MPDDEMLKDAADFGFEGLQIAEPILRSLAKWLVLSHTEQLTPAALDALRNTLAGMQQAERFGLFGEHGLEISLQPKPYTRCDLARVSGRTLCATHLAAHDTGRLP